MKPSVAVEVVHAPAQSRFEARRGEHLCVADYRMEGQIMHMTHTFVPHALEGQGIAAALVSAAFDHARISGYRINPVCSYVAVWANRHPEVLPLLV